MPQRKQRITCPRCHGERDVFVSKPQLPELCQACRHEEQRATRVTVTCPDCGATRMLLRCTMKHQKSEYCVVCAQKHRAKPRKRGERGPDKAPRERETWDRKAFWESVGNRRFDAAVMAVMT